MGGWSWTHALKSTEVFPKRENCSSILDSLTIKIHGQPSLIQTSDEEILLCGGSTFLEVNAKRCFVYKGDKWSEHSDHTYGRKYASAVSMQDGIYIFGGDTSTWEWLPSGTNQWQIGSTSFSNPWDGCAVKINDNEILLISGRLPFKEMKFNTNTKNFTKLGQVLNLWRTDHSCTRFEDKIIVTGGRSSIFAASSSTKIIDLNNLSKARNAGNLVQARHNHGLVVVHVDNQPTVLAVGGEYYDGGWIYLDSIEMWNPTTETWMMTSMKLTEPKEQFGILSLPTRLLCP